MLTIILSRRVEPGTPLQDKVRSALESDEVFSLKEWH